MSRRSCEHAILPHQDAYVVPRMGGGSHDSRPGTNGTNVPPPGCNAEISNSLIDSEDCLMMRSVVWGRRGTPRRAPGGYGHIAAAGHRRPAIRIGIVDDPPVFTLGL